MIREAQPADARAIIHLIIESQATWSAWYPRFTPYSFMSEEPVWRERLSNPAYVTLVHSADGVIDGVVSFGPESLSESPSRGARESAHVAAVFVAPQVQGTGVAQALHIAMLDWLALCGYHAARLWCPEGNLRAERFYLRNGWTATDRRLEEHETMTMMRREYRRELP